ncbi:MAG: substrate-binding domain-containing protein [Butyricicoccus sp.]
MNKTFATRVFGTVLAGTMLAGMLVGCGSSSGTGDASSDSADSAAASAPSGLISVISREDGSGTRGAFIELTGVQTEENGNKTDNTTMDAVIANQTEVMMQNVAGDANAIGYASMGSLNDSVKAVAIDGVEATTDNVLNGEYSLSRPFNIVLNGDAEGAAADFINYILSEDGQQVVSDAGYIPVDSESGAFESDGSKGDVTVAGSSSVSPVMEKLKEAYEEINPDAKITIETSDSTTGVNSTIEGICDIGMASRELSEEEAAEVQSVQIALDGIAVIVNPENALDGLTTEQVRQIFTGEVTDWEDVAAQ